MDRFLRVICAGALPVFLGFAAAHAAGPAKSSDKTPQYTPALSAGAAGAKPDMPSQEVEVTADQSLEWYQDQHMYVARGHAKAVRGDMQVEADLLSAHERETPSNAKDSKAPKPPKPASGTSGPGDGTGDIDRMIADGHVVITDPRERITGDHAVDNLDQHVAIVTGKDLLYETEKETVTAKDSLEYWDEKKIAVARGHAVAIGSDRHVEADVLTAAFRDGPDGQQQLWKMTADGHVTVITKTDVVRGDKAVYDLAGDVAVVTDHVRITRPDGTELTGDVAEVDFKTNRSRLMNEGHGRVRALLTPKTTGKTSSETPDDSGAAPKRKHAKTPEGTDGAEPGIALPVPATKFGS